MPSSSIETYAKNVFGGLFSVGAQNLNEKPGGTLGSIAKYGRAWLHWGKNYRAGLGLTWLVGLEFAHAWVRIGGKKDLEWSVAAPGGALWLALEETIPKGLIPDETFEIGWSVHDKALWFDFLTKPMGHPEAGVRFRFDPMDLVFGEQEYEEVEIESERVQLPFPERPYVATVRLVKGIWRRPRLLLPYKQLRAHIEPDERIPVPGRGEDVWNCGSEGVYNMTTPAKTVDEAVEIFVKTVLRTREKRLDPNWQPEVIPKGRCAR